MPRERPASPERVAALREAWRVWNEEGVDAFVERYWDPEMVWDERGIFPDAGVHRGREACRRRVADRFEYLGEVEIEAGEVIVIGEHEIQELVARGRGAKSRVPTEMRYYVVVSGLRDGRVLLMREFATREGAVAAIEAEARATH